MFMRDRRERKERQDKTKGRVPVMVTRRRCLRLCYLKLCIDCALMLDSHMPKQTRVHRQLVEAFQEDASKI
jgi:hypothetical protein